MRAVVGCPYQCEAVGPGCNDCPAAAKGAVAKTHLVSVPVVDLPLGATEDRVVGALDLERALAQGVKAFEPGLLARANRGFLYIDEVNLLEDHPCGPADRRRRLGRERRRARGPERAPPCALRAGGQWQSGRRANCARNCSTASAWPWTCARRATSPPRVEVVRRRDNFERGPEAFVAQWKKEEDRLRRRIVAARERLPQIEAGNAALERAASLCMALGTDGLRGELTLLRAARALAALDGDGAVADTHLRRVARPALRHRLRRDVLDDH